MVSMFGKVSPKSIRTALVSQICYGWSAPVPLQWPLGLCPGLGLGGSLLSNKRRSAPFIETGFQIIAKEGLFFLLILYRINEAMPRQTQDLAMH